MLDLSTPLFPKAAVFRDVVLKALAGLLPNLREINLTNTQYTRSGLSDLGWACHPQLEKITRNSSNWSVCLTGDALQRCDQLKELYMYNSLFSSFHEVLQQCIFSECNSKLERVSIKNGRSHLSQSFQDLPQVDLVNFVRCTPNLRWFRSNLTLENVAILQVERPEITLE